MAGESSAGFDPVTSQAAAAGTSPAASGIALSRTGSPGIDAELALSRWSGLALTYAFPTSAAAYPVAYAGVGHEPTTGFAPLGASLQAAVTTALLTQYGAVTPLSFTLAAPDTPGTTIRAAISSAANPTAYAYYPGSGAAGGDVWFGPALFGPGASEATATPADYAWLTVLHELGHAMGLKHPHEADAGNPVLAPPARNSMEFSVMTYASYIGAPTTGGYRNEAAGYAQSLMMDDIQALQALYGANYASHAEDTTYAFNPATGEAAINGVAQGRPAGNRVFQTIWDGGGTDSYDFSAYATNLRVDLSPGGWSTLSAAQLALLGSDAAGPHLARGNVFNALQYQGDPRSLVENALGGSGDDLLLGNAANNLLVGNGGNDTLDGAAGRDTAVLHLPRAAANLLHNADGSWSLTSAEGSDTLHSIERLAFADGTAFLAPVARTDFSGTGLATLLAGTDSGAVALLPLSGAPQPVATARPGWHLATSGDFDGDGLADLFWRQDQGTTFLELHSGAAVVNATGFGTVEASWQLAPSGDFNADGRADLLWRHEGGDTYLWLMNGLDAPATHDFGVVGASWRIAGLGDLDGDARADVLWRNSDGQSYAWLMDGSAIAGQGLLSAQAGTDWQVVGLGDLNGDGRADLVWEDPAGAVTAWLMNGLAVLAMGSLGSVDAARWTLAEVLDVDGDDTADLAWQATDGAVWLWTMQDGSVASQANAATLAEGWHLLAA